MFILVLTMQKIVSISFVLLAIGFYSIVHFDNPYRDKLFSYWHRFELVQDIGSSNTVDYDLLSSGLQNIVTENPSRYRPYEFAALFVSTLNKLNPTISSGNVDALLAIATAWLYQDCDRASLEKILATSSVELSWLVVSDPVCRHKQLSSLLALTYSTYKSNPEYAKKLYFLIEHSK